jgi:hypothetical protein
MPLDTLTADFLAAQPRQERIASGQDFIDDHAAGFHRHEDFPGCESCHQDANPFFCFDCGDEMTPADVKKQVRDNGVFYGKCTECLDTNGVN